MTATKLFTRLFVRIKHSKSLWLLSSLTVTFRFLFLWGKYLVLPEMSSSLKKIHKYELREELGDAVLSSHSTVPYWIRTDGAWWHCCRGSSHPAHLPSLFFFSLPCADVTVVVSSVSSWLWRYSGSSWSILFGYFAEWWPQDIFLIFGLQLWDLGQKTTAIKCHFHVTESRVWLSNLTMVTVELTILSGLKHSLSSFPRSTVSFSLVCTILCKDAPL